MNSEQFEGNECQAKDAWENQCSVRCTGMNQTFYERHRQRCGVFDGSPIPATALSCCINNRNDSTEQPGSSSAMSTCQATSTDLATDSADRSRCFLFRSRLLQNAARFHKIGSNLDLGVANEGDWSEKAKSMYNLVYKCFPKPNS